MSSILDEAKKPVDTPIIVTIYGQPGTGKTSLACTLPRPVYLISSPGESVPRDLPDSLRPATIGTTDSVEKLWQQTEALVREKHKFRTIVIDSVSGFDALFADHVTQKSGADSLARANGGYGAGYSAVLQLHTRLRRDAELLRARGRNVVFLAHSQLKQIEPPDSDSFSQYSIMLGEKFVGPYINAVDLVGFLREKTAVTARDGSHNRAVSVGWRELIAHTNPAAVTKNRLGITEALSVERGVNPLAGFFTAPKPPLVVSDGDAAGHEQSQSAE